MNTERLKKDRAPQTLHGAFISSAAGGQAKP
jgi:hypothetical protein